MVLLYSQENYYYETVTKTIDRLMQGVHAMAPVGVDVVDLKARPATELTPLTQIMPMSGKW